MRLKYYLLTLRQMKLKKSFVFLLILVCLIIYFVYVINKRVEPVIKSLCDITAKNIALNVTNETVNDYIKTITYDSLIITKQDSSGKIVSIDANVMEMNRLSTNISSSINDKISNIGAQKIRLPLGSILNLGLLSGYGPNIGINVIPNGTVNAQFKSEFTETGINQTRHRIYIEITTSMYIVAPFFADTQTYTNDITVAETILVGNTPSTYYNLNGLTKDNAVNVIK